LTDVALVLPNLKTVAVEPSAKPAPVIVTFVLPASDPAFGLTLLTVGRNLKRSFGEIALVPPAVVTVTSTVPADPAGELAVIEVAELTVKLVALLEPSSTALAATKFVTEVPEVTVKLVALLEPNLTAVAALRLVPVIVTEVPPAVGPELGLTLVTAGWTM
jgi:hypothetical protein